MIEKIHDDISCREQTGSKDKGGGYSVASGFTGQSHKEGAKRQCSTKGLKRSTLFREGKKEMRRKTILIGEQLSYLINNKGIPNNITFTQEQMLVKDKRHFI